jgi:hypothetical protein
MRFTGHLWGLNRFFSTVFFGSADVVCDLGKHQTQNQLFLDRYIITEDDMKFLEFIATDLGVFLNIPI